MWSLKSGVPYFYDVGQEDLFKERIANGGHISITAEQAQEILSPRQTLTVQALKAQITQKRWEVETGGITLPNGVHVATGIDDQNRITSVVANAERAGVVEVDFKAPSGWIRITLAELQAVAVAVALHVQACFSAERAHHEAIDALAQLHAEDADALQSSLQAYDIEQGWPSNDLSEEVPHD